MVRSQALPADERRAMLVRATLPLLIEHGDTVTTRMIAEAAGVAEGPIFRVFPDKQTLIRAAIWEVFDPEPTLADLRGVDMTLPLRVRTLQVASILQRRLIRVFNLMIALRMHKPDAEEETRRDAAHTANRLVLVEVVRILEPDAARLRWPPMEVARVLRLLIFSGSHPLITEGNLLGADEITEVLLDGLLRPSGGPTPDDNDGGTHC
jgi:AcrR family transcriptional regulator